MIKMIYDNEADAVYIYFSKYPEGKTEKTYLCNPAEIKGMINLDFTNNKLVGIEVMDASQKLTDRYLKRKKANFNYNQETNVATIGLSDDIEVKSTYKCETQKFGGLIELNFNSNDRLFEIVIYNANVLLKQELLNYKRGNVLIGWIKKLLK